MTAPKKTPARKAAAKPQPKPKPKPKPEPDHVDGSTAVRHGISTKSAVYEDMVKGSVEGTIEALDGSLVTGLVLPVIGNEDLAFRGCILAEKRKTGTYWMARHEVFMGNVSHCANLRTGPKTRRVAKGHLYFLVELDGRPFLQNVGVMCRG